MRRRLPVSGLIVLVIGLTPISGASGAVEKAILDPTAPRSQHDFSDSTSDPSGEVGLLDEAAIDALVIQSFSQCSSELMLWSELNERWAELGASRVHIDYDSRPFCRGAFTYDQLVERNPDVVILSNPANADSTFDADEMAAVDRYVREGHGAVASALLVGLHDLDALAPMLGITAVMRPYGQSFQPRYRQRLPAHPLVRGMSDPYLTFHPRSQRIEDRPWDRADRADTARFLGKATGRKAAILVNQPDAGMTVYVSSMPEFTGGELSAMKEDDLQLVYNAIVWTSS